MLDHGADEIGARGEMILKRRKGDARSLRDLADREAFEPAVAQERGRSLDDLECLALRRLAARAADSLHRRHEFRFDLLGGERPLSRAASHKSGRMLVQMHGVDYLPSLDFLSSDR